MTPEAKSIARTSREQMVAVYVCDENHYRISIERPAVSLASSLVVP